MEPEDCFSQSDETLKRLSAFVNNLAVGQTEACLSQLRLAQVASKKAGAGARDAQARDGLITAMHQVLSSLKLRQQGSVDPATVAASLGQTITSVAPSFRVAASSIAPSSDSVVFAIANSVGETADAVDWDDELPVLIGVVIHALGNAVHGMATVPPAESSVALASLMSLFDFVLEHDGTPNSIDFARFLSILSHLDVLLDAREDEASWTHGSTESSLGLLTLLWNLTSKFVTRASYASYFNSLQSSSSSAPPSMIAPYLLSPLRVVRSLTVFYPPPPTEEELAEMEADRQALRRSRNLAAKGDGFVRASQRVKRAAQLPRSILSLPQQLLCIPALREQRDAVVDMLLPHPLLHSFMNEFLDFCESSAFGTVALLKRPVPLKPPAKWAAYVRELVQHRQSTNIIRCVVTEVVESLCSPASPAGTGGTQPSLGTESFFAIAKSFLDDPVLTPIRPFVMYELYAKQRNRSRLFNSRFALTFQDHAVLIDYLSTTGGPKASDDVHPCFTLINDIQLLVKLTSFLEKNNDIVGRAGFDSAKVLLMLLDTHGDVVSYIIRGERELGAAPTVSSSSAAAAATPGSSSSKRTMFFQNLISMFVSVNSLQAQFLRKSSAKYYSDELTKTVARQIFFLHAVVVVQFVFDNFTSTEVTPPLQDFATVVRDFSDSAVKSDTTQQQASSPSGQFYETVVEIVVTVCAQYILLPALGFASSSSPTPGGDEKLSSSSGGGDGGRRALSIFCNVVQLLQQNCDACLSDAVKSSLKDVLFRAKQLYENRRDQGEFLASMEASLICDPPRKGREALQVDAFAQSPYGFLLTAVKAKNFSRAEEVLMNLFLRAQSQQQGAATATTTKPHHALVFCFISARLSYVQRHQLSVEDFLQQLMSISGSSENSSSSVLFAPEELWFLEPSTVATTPTVQSQISRSVGSRGVSGFQEAALIRRFTDSVQAIQAGADLALDDKDIFCKFLSPSLPPQVSRSVIKSVVAAISRLSFISATSSTTVDDLLQVLEQCEALAHPQEQYWTCLECPSFSSSENATRQAGSENPLVYFLQHLKALSTAVTSIDPSAPTHVQFLLSSGYQVLYTAAKSGALLSFLQEGGIGGDGRGAISRRDILKIVLGELMVDVFGGKDSTAANHLEAKELINILRVVEFTDSYAKALLLLHVLQANQAVDVSRQFGAAKEGEVAAWMQPWLAQQQSRVQSMLHIEHKYLGTQVSGEDDEERASSVARRTLLLLRKSAQVQYLSDLLKKLLSSNSVEATKQLVISLSGIASAQQVASDLLASLSSISDEQQQSDVQVFLVEVLASIGANNSDDDKSSPDDVVQGTAHTTIAGILLQMEDIALRLSFLLPVLPEAMPAPPAGRSALLTGAIPHAAQISVLESTRDVLLARHAQDGGDDNACRQLLELTQSRILYLRRLQQLAADVQALIAKKPRASMTFGIRTVSVDPVNFSKVKNVQIVVDELLELGKNDALPVCCELLLLAAKSNLVAVTPEEKQALSKAFASLYLRKCLAFSHHLDVNASASPPRRKTFHAKSSVGAADSKSDVQFLLDFLAVAKDELGTVDAFASTLVLPPANENSDAPFCRAIMEEVVANPRLRLSSAFRLVRLALETPFLAPLFSGDQRWSRIVVSLQILNVLQDISRQALLESQDEDEEDEAKAADRQQEAAEITIFEGSKAFLPEPLLILENLLMAQRLRAAASILPLIQSVEKESCDKMLLSYAQKAVEISHYELIPEDEFPQGKSKAARPQNVSSPLPLPPPPLELRLTPQHSSAQRHQIRTQFSFPFAPNVALFKGLVSLCSNRAAANTRLLAVAEQLYDSVSDYSNLTMRIIAVDIAEQVVSAITPHGPKELQLLGSLEVARHLIVCCWPSVPKLAELADREFTMQLISELLQKGQIKAAYAIAERCGVNINDVQSLFIDRATQLLTLGMYDEAATTIERLPQEKIHEVISAVLLQIEFTPVPHNYRAHAVDGQYLVKQHHVSDISALTLKRQVGLRTLVARFGRPVDILALHIRHREFPAAIKIAVELKKEEPKLIEFILDPLTTMSSIDQFQAAMKSVDRTLENLRFLIIAFCKHLEGSKRYEELLCWQKFMHDYARGAHTATLLAHLDLPCAKKLAYLTEAEQLLINAKFQPTAKTASPPHAEDGTVLPLSRLDAQKIQIALQQCRLQRDLLNNLNANGLDFNKLTLYGDKEQTRGVVVELLIYGKNFFDLAMTIVSSFSVDLVTAFGQATEQLLKAKKHDVVETQMENLKRALIPEPEKNHAYAQMFMACTGDVVGGKKSAKLAESILTYMTTAGGHKVNCYLAQGRWKDAFEDAMKSKDNKAILAVYERAQEAPQSDEVEYVVNNTRTYLARNAMR